MVDQMFSKKLKKTSTAKKKALEERLKNANEIIDSGDKEKILTEKEIKSLFYDRTQKHYSSEKLLEFLEEQFYSKPCRILK